MKTEKRSHLALVVVLTIIVRVVTAQTIPSPAATTASAHMATTTAQATTGRGTIASQPLQEDAFFKFYAANLRAIFFTGCLTLSSFLLAASTFIVINLKKEVYDSEGYREKVLGAKTGTTHYGPLRRLSALLIFNIGVALLASLLQVTVGIVWDTRNGAIFCITAVGLAILLLFVTLFLIGLNLHDWFAHMEQQAAKARAPA